MIQLHMMLLFALVRLSTQSMDLFQTAIVPTETQKLQLILTDAANLFASLTPAQGLQPPILPAVTSLWQIINSNIPQPTASLTVVPTPSAPSTSSEEPDIPTTTPSFRLPVSTRPPGVPHHRSVDEFGQSELIDKIYKFMNEHETFELRYTNRFKPVENPSEAPEIVNDGAQLKTLPTTPPLIHNSDYVLSSRAAFSETSDEFDESNFLSLPETPAVPFSTILTD